MFIKTFSKRFVKNCFVQPNKIELYYKQKLLVDFFKLLFSVKLLEQLLVGHEAQKRGKTKKQQSQKNYNKQLKLYLLLVFKFYYIRRQFVFHLSCQQNINFVHKKCTHKANTIVKLPIFMETLSFIDFVFLLLHSQYL